jgi:kinesin family protein 5
MHTNMQISLRNSHISHLICLPAGSSGGAAERVKVVVRVRPPVTSEEKASGAVNVVVAGNQLTLQREHTVTMPQSEFRFDQILDVDATQQDVFASVKEVVEDVLKGYNGTLMAYGQTGEAPAVLGV